MSTHNMPDRGGSAVPKNDEGCAACRPAHPACSLENSHTDCADEPNKSKSKKHATIAASLALRGFALHVTAAGTYIVARWNLARELPSLDAVDDFARRAGAL